jgi:hypothetical protein
VRFTRQLDHGQPEIVDAPHDFEKAIEAYRLGDITIRMELIALQDIGLGCRGRQYNDRNAP